jgi:hypothetical protein
MADNDMNTTTDQDMENDRKYSQDTDEEVNV